MKQYQPKRFLSNYRIQRAFRTLTVLVTPMVCFAG